jgi:hypothetical protein
VVDAGAFGSTASDERFSRSRMPSFKPSIPWSAALSMISGSNG